ncbi:MAG: DUF2147 domain-containing protein [Alphaproteobacteria bacterium]|nr:DUF2147 domain-containing protein [Alphaproteobacteria bacterium]
MRILALLAAVFIATPAFAADPVEGLWLTQNERSVINVYECDQGLCGDIYWIIDGGMQYDTKNPDASKHKDPMCGLRILYGFEKDEVGEWEDGKIYKADEGDVYNANVEINDNGTLKVRGYVGISMFGKSQKWTKVSADDYAQCNAPANADN